MLHIFIFTFFIFFICIVCVVLFGERKESQVIESEDPPQAKKETKSLSEEEKLKINDIMNNSELFLKRSTEKIPYYIYWLRYPILFADNRVPIKEVNQCNDNGTEYYEVHIHPAVVDSSCKTIVLKLTEKQFKRNILRKIEKNPIPIQNIMLELVEEEIELDLIDSREKELKEFEERLIPQERK